MKVMRVVLFGLVSMLAMNAGAQSSVIRGSVLDMQGRPMPGDVVAYRLSVVRGNIVPHPTCFTIVDKAGHFQCRHIKNGAYVLLFSLHQPAPKPELKASSPTKPGVAPATSYADLASTPRVGNVPLIASYPALSDWQLSNLLRVGTNDTQFVSVAVDNDADSTLEAAPALGFATGQVQLFVVGEGFVIPVNMQAHVNPQDGNYLWEGLPAGRYRVNEDWGAGKIPVNVYRSVTIGTGTTLKTSLAGLRGYSLRGSIAATGVTVIPPSIEFVKQDASSLERYAASVGKGGRFKFSSLPEGTYDIAFPLTSKVSVSSVQINGNTGGEESVYVGESISNSSILIEAKSGVGSISGSVRLDGSERHPGIVIQSALSGTGIAVPVNSNGFFRVSALPFGQYLVTGWSDLSKVPYNNAAFLAHYRDDAASVTVNRESGGDVIDVSCNNSSL